MKNIRLDFEGYWREIKKNCIPDASGIYCVYACTYNENAGTVSIRELIYVGESDNVRNRISNHERLADWKKRLRPNETLCYSFAGISENDRVRAEAAVIFHHKPPCNTEYRNSFPFDTTTVTTSGDHAKLDPAYTVSRT